VADSISFSSVVSLDASVLSNCSLCQSEPAWLQYVVHSDIGISDVITDVCCAGCAQGLLDSLEKLQKAQLTTARNLNERKRSQPNDQRGSGSRTSPSVP
jgi:hypothetical protein